jgi:hypothetical protein
MCELPLRPRTYRTGDRLGAPRAEPPEAVDLQSTRQLPERGPGGVRSRLLAETVPVGLLEMTGETPHRQLTVVEHEVLARADDRLRYAVAEYIRAVDDRADAAQIEALQIEIGAAEDQLWRHRAALLNRYRPPWAPSASLVADWFSPEDRVYDEMAVP